MEDTRSKRKYTVTDEARASARLNLEKARAVGKDLYRPTDKRLDACRANLEKARESPNYKPFVRHGLGAVDLRRSAPQVGESQEELDRHLERVQSVVPAHTRRERNAVQGLAQALWRRQRVFTSPVDWEILRFYQEVEQAAVDGLAPCSIHALFRDVSDLFLEGEDPRLEIITECLDQRLERMAQAYLTERAGRKICLGPLGHYRHSEAFLDQPPETIGNALLRPGQPGHPTQLQSTWSQEMAPAARSSSGSGSKDRMVDELPIVGATEKHGQNGQTDPSSGLESTTYLKKRTENGAIKSFRSGVGLKNEPKARPLSPLERQGPGKRTRTLSSDFCERFASLAPSAGMNPPPVALRWLGSRSGNQFVMVNNGSAVEVRRELK